MRILLSSGSEFVVVLRLMLLLVNLRAIGSLCFRAHSLPNTARIQLGLGLSFLAVLVGSALQHNAPGRITPILLYGLLAAGWVSLFLRARSLKRGSWPGLPAALVDAVPFLLLLVVAGTVVYADWPRWVPLTSDPQQHAFFARKVIDARCIPRALTEMGGDPFNYPAGTGVLGYLIYALCGLLPAESVSLANGIFLLLFSLALVEAAHAARLPLAQRCLLCVIPFMAGIGGFGAWDGHSGLGKLVSFWLAQTWLVQLFLMRRPATSGLPMLVQFVFLLVLAAALNPTLAIYWAWIGLLTLVAWKRARALTWGRVIAGVVLLAAALALMIAVDPFFRDMATGRGVPAPSMDHLPRGEIHFQAAGESYFVARLARFLVALVQDGPRHGVVFLVLGAIILLGNARSLRRVSPKALLLALGAILLPSALLAGMSTYLAIPDGSGATLIAPYNTKVLSLSLWLAAFVLAVWSLDSLSALFRPRGLRLACAGVLILGFSVSAVCFGIEPHLKRHGRLPKVPPVNQKVPPGLGEATRAIAELWSNDPGAKVLLVNWEWTRSPPERWIMPDQFSAAVALLPHANPAFFFYKGSPDYSYDNYFSKVCAWNADWLTDRGVRWVLLPRKADVDRRCAVLGQAALDDRYDLRSVALVERPAAPPEPRDP